MARTTQPRPPGPAWQVPPTDSARSRMLTTPSPVPPPGTARLSAVRVTSAGETVSRTSVGDPGACLTAFVRASCAMRYTVEGDAGRLPATTGLAVYRIAQEALTNAAKHAPGSPTDVRLTVSPGEVTLTADSQAAPGSGTGLGVVSMRERAESVGGTCEAGPGGRGWLVRAALPVTALPGTALPDTGGRP